MLSVRYKKGFSYKFDDGTTVSIIRPARGQYQVTGFYGTNYPDKHLDLFYSKVYSTLKGVASFLSKNFDIELIYDDKD